MQVFVHSEAGHGHVNEDAVLIERHPYDTGMWLCALADGQGGQVGGREASQMAVEVAVKEAGKYAPLKLSKGRLWPTIISAVDDAVESDSNAGFTTLIALCVTEDRVCGGSCGDSGVLLVSKSGDSILTEGQFKNPPVGSSGANGILFNAPLQPGDKLLVVSDGVWKFIGWDKVGAACRQFHGNELLSRLRVLAARYQDQLLDDFTIALFEA